MTTITLNTNLFISNVTSDFYATSAALLIIKISPVIVDHISNQKKNFASLQVFEIMINRSLYHYIYVTGL